MKDETKADNHHYGNENFDTMNIYKDNDYKNIRKINPFFYHNRSISINNSFNKNFLSQSCCINDGNKNNLSLRKIKKRIYSYCDFKNNINNLNPNLKEEKISVNELRLNVKNVKEYSDDILENLIEEEKNKIKINPNYFHYQYEINPSMRSILIDWIIGIHNQLKLKEETLYISIYILDAYLSKQFITKKYFQLLGVTSLFLASKLNEIFIRRITDYSFITNNIYNENEIKNMEKEILKTLNFDILKPTPLSFYEIITQKTGISDDVNKYKFGGFLMQTFLINNQSLNFTYSCISCATCYIIMKFCGLKNYGIIFDNKFLNKNINNNSIIINSNYYNNEYYIKHCARKMCETINRIINSNLKSTINKYSDNIYFNSIKRNMLACSSSN
jgi:hypothetical protein